MLEWSNPYFLIMGAWCAYFVLHSVLAADRVKRVVAKRWPRLTGRYRLFYNMTALVLLVVPVKLTFEARGEPLWLWPGLAGYVADFVAVLAGGGFLATFFAYDLGEFSGLRSAASPAARDPALRISFLHRFVRHPWYFFILVILWSREMDAALLTTAIVMTVYLIVGSRLEERRLIRMYGERYRKYRRAVPALVPRPWRKISAQEASALESKVGLP